MFKSLKIEKTETAIDCATDLNASFARDESGSMTSFTLIAFLGMLVASGMAIDFLRFKAEQTRVQDIADRAVLAAAKLENDLDPADVVRSYFNVNDASANLIGTPQVEDLGNYKRVGVETNVSVDTHFLKLTGINDLETIDTSTAIQGLGDIEISLVLDISYSMRGAKIAELRQAALAFAQEALDPEHNGKVSLNVIAYSGNINVGQPMFEYLNTTSFLDGVPYEDTLVAGAETADDLSDDVVYPDNVSHCVEFNDADFSNAVLPSNRVQTPHFIGLDRAIPFDAEWWCPLDGGEIRYGQQVTGDLTDPDSLASYLAALPMGLGTSTHIGAKYGLALLDPSSQPAFAHLAGLDLVADDFADRPKQYDQLGVQKIMVVMTDGAVWHTRHPKDILDPRNLTSGSFEASKNRHEAIRDKTENVVSFLSVCDLAKAPGRNIQVYTVAFDANQTAQDEMRACSSGDAFFRTADQGDLTNAFEDIAGQISELRLVN